MGKKILAIGGHIGDMELTCGGILAECALKGGEIVTKRIRGIEARKPYAECFMSQPEDYKVIRELY